jgi:hypothetical protein
MARFNFNASTHWEAEEYLLHRSRQLLRHRVFLTHMYQREHGVVALYNCNGITFQGIYVLENSRGQGNFKKLFVETGFPVITLDDCLMERWLVEHDIPHVCLRSYSVKEYRVIERAYGAKEAKRSGVMYMNHIDEGLAVLQWIGAPEDAKAAYCLHPVFQTDLDLGTAAAPLVDYWKDCSPVSVMLAMEYRSVANEYLSDRAISSVRDIRRSPLAEVNHMLIADKVQNRKDFELHHEKSHPRSKELAQYFRNWMEALQVSEEEYQRYKHDIMSVDRIAIKLGDHLEVS